MDDITVQFEECLRRHLRSTKPTAINYDVELVRLGLDSMTAVAVSSTWRRRLKLVSDDMLVEGTFRTAGRLKEAVQSPSRAKSVMTRPLPDQSFGSRVDDLEPLARGIVTRGLAMEPSAREYSHEFVGRRGRVLGTGR